MEVRCTGSNARANGELQSRASITILASLSRPLRDLLLTAINFIISASYTYLVLSIIQLIPSIIHGRARPDILFLYTLSYYIYIYSS